MSPASNSPPSAATNGIADLVRAYPRRSATLLAGLLASTAVWHITLPGLFFRSAAVFIEGPLPAICGATVALWLHRDDTPTGKTLAACGWAFAACLLAVIAFGLPLFGILATLSGLLTLARNALRFPFLDLTGPYAPWLLWMGLKAVLTWCAVAYVVLLYRRHGRAGLRELLTGWSEQRTFNASQREQWRAYRSLYAKAVKAGETLPAAPASLAPQGYGREPSAFGWARSTYWLARAGLALAGAGGLYAFLSQDLGSQLAQLLFRGWFG